MDSKTGKWIASISFKNKRYYLGSSDDKNDAAKVRKKAEDVMFGEFLDYYESELKEKHEEKVERIKEKYMAEVRAFAKEVKGK